MKSFFIFFVRFLFIIGPAIALAQASHTPRPMLDLGLSKIPIFTDAEIDAAPEAEIRQRAVDYAIYIYQGAEQLRAAPLHVAHPFPPEMRETYLKIYRDMPIEKLRERAKDIYRPGGVARVNRQVYAELDPLLIEWEKKTLVQFGIKADDKVFLRKEPDLSPDGIRALNKVIMESATSFEVPKPTHPSGRFDPTYVSVLLTVCGLIGLSVFTFWGKNKAG